MPLWKTAGFAFGIATALFGEEAALTCKSAVEVAIGEYYNHQIRELLADDPVSHAELLEVSIHVPHFTSYKVHATPRRS